jgi:hypothetical protein
MKKLFMVLAAVLSLGVSQLAMADSCGIYARTYQAPVKRVVVVAPFHRPVVRWIAWHRDHRFYRYF